MLGRDYLAKVARKTLTYQGLPEHAWDQIGVHRQEACIDGVSSVIQALDELGWTFVPPERGDLAGTTKLR
jgi:hypothetical protein